MKNPWEPAARRLLCSTFVALVTLSWTSCSVYDPARVSLAPEPRTGAAGQLATGSMIDAVSAVACGQGQQRCELPHAQALCIEKKCTVTACDERFEDCDGDAANGCEADLTSAEHCGRCWASCHYLHGEASCNFGQCVLSACEPGYGNCDADPNNGCERSLSRATDCGECNKPCAALPHAGPACEQGHCGAACEPGFGDCNGVLSDGCETPLNAEPNCGGCGVRCAGAHAIAAECQSGQCVLTQCEAGYADCNQLAADGCEVQLNSTEHCGQCGVDCEMPHVARPLCSPKNDAVQCQIDTACALDELDCAPSPRNGCNAGYADCDGRPENGCETSLSRLSTCGACDVSCVDATAVTECRNGVCFKLGCSPGFADCANRGECRSLLDDPNNCGACGRTCSGATPRCRGGQCTGQACGAGLADCDGRTQNQCETDLTQPEHCGGCSISCMALANTSSVACVRGRCEVGMCKPGFADCDRDAKNGCEIALDTADDCGACGATCVLPHASETSCQRGQCTVVECTPKRADCNGLAADGCEADLTLPAHCGSCAAVCDALPNVASAACARGRCSDLVCDDGFADCNGEAADGCETNLASGASCGACGMDCGHLPNVASSGCSAAMCRSLVCDARYGDCDMRPDNGCERSLASANDCGACNRPCAPANAPADCSAGVCRHGPCAAGFADCDGDAANGCETRLGTTTACSACGDSCEPGAPCKNGTCGCARDAQCATGTQCCGGDCLPTVGECFLWPCIPGTDLSQNRMNCGGCGQTCLTFCCGPLF